MSRLALVALLLILPASAHPSPGARAVLLDASGREVGSAVLSQEDRGVVVHLRVWGLSPGHHAFHVHAVGRCEGPGFTSAGPHLNPAGKKHGLRSPEGAHLGDLPNLDVDSDGEGEAEVLVKGATLAAGATSLLGPEGTALVVHDKPDDGMTDPAGNAGARIACGVVTPDGG